MITRKERRSCGEVLMAPDLTKNKNDRQTKIIIRTSMETDDGQLFRLEPESLTALAKVARLFKSGRIYREKEVNEILQEVYDDYVTLRRYLIEHGFLDRKPDGSQYWLK